MVHSFLMLGQSNMAGRGDIAQATPIRQAEFRILKSLTRFFTELQQIFQTVL